MFHILFTLSLSQNDFGNIININEYLSQEDAPSFQELPTDDDEFHLEGKIGVDTSLSANIDQKKRENEFYASSVTISGGQYSSCYAFGAGAAAGSGGAIFISYSSLVVTSKSTKFNLNIASVGGALCSLCSAVSMQTCPSFETNTAYKYGGAIYFQGVFEKGSDDKLIYSLAAILNLNANELPADPQFKDNKAGEIGGVIVFLLVVICGMENI